MFEGPPVWGSCRWAFDSANLRAAFGPLSSFLFPIPYLLRWTRSRHRWSTPTAAFASSGTESDLIQDDMIQRILSSSVL